MACNFLQNSPLIIDNNARFSFSFFFFLNEITLRFLRCPISDDIETANVFFLKKKKKITSLADIA